MAGVYFSEDAGEDLRGIGDCSVMAEILELARSELQEPQGQSVLEGVVYRDSVLWWRRAVPRSQLDALSRYELDHVDEFTRQACDYVLVYRRVTEDEAIHYQCSRRALLVVRVVYNTEITPHLAGLSSLR